MKRKEKIPQHVALIMDGNRRWARRNKKPLYKGHLIGEERIEPIIDLSLEKGIKYLTFWAFSTENWGRKKREINFLLQLFRRVLNKKIDDFHKKQVKIKVIGNLKMFPQDLQKKIGKWISKTKNNKKIVVNFALSYGGRDELIRAINKWCEKSKIKKFSPTGKQEKSKISSEEFEKYLDTAGQPDPDLLIRTGGEKRLSGFLLWQIEYTELYFTDVLWPDFTQGEFVKAIKEYQKRQRKYGK